MPEPIIEAPHSTIAGPDALGPTAWGGMRPVCFRGQDTAKQTWPSGGASCAAGAGPGLVSRDRAHQVESKDDRVVPHQQRARRTASPTPSARSASNTGFCMAVMKPEMLGERQPYPIRRQRIVAVLLMAYFLTHPAHVSRGNVVERLRVIPRFAGLGDPHALHSRPSEVQKVFAPLA